MTTETNIAAETTIAEGTNTTGQTNTAAATTTRTPATDAVPTIPSYAFEPSLVHTTQAVIAGIEALLLATALAAPAIEASAFSPGRPSDLTGRWLVGLVTAWRCSAAAYPSDCGERVSVLAVARAEAFGLAGCAALCVVALILAVNRCAWQLRHRVWPGSEGAHFHCFYIALASVGALCLVIASCMLEGLRTSTDLVPGLGGRAAEADLGAGWIALLLACATAVMSVVIDAVVAVRSSWPSDGADSRDVLLATTAALATLAAGGLVAVLASGSMMTTLVQRDGAFVAVGLSGRCCARPAGSAARTGTGRAAGRRASTHRAR